jgi:hypothetical protein
MASTFPGLRTSNEILPLISTDYGTNCSKNSCSYQAYTMYSQFLVVSCHSSILPNRFFGSYIFIQGSCIFRYSRSGSEVVSPRYSFESINAHLRSPKSMVFAVSQTPVKEGKALTILAMI